MPQDSVQSKSGGSEQDGSNRVFVPGQLDGAEHLKIHLGASVRHRRLDTYLQARFNQFSRTTVQRLIKEQGVKVNGRIAKPSCRIHPGDRIDLVLPPSRSREIIPEDIPLNIIYEDEEMIVLNKQANLIVHPARGNTHGTLVNALVYYADKLSKGGGEFRPGIVHRLDRNTTGVMVVAKTDTAHWRLARQFELRKVKKTYLAVVHGSPELDADCIKQPLGVHPIVREKYAIRPEGGKQATTFYEVLERFQGFSLLKMAPRTGRTHQIRVHLSYIKHPIVGDDMYDGRPVYPWQIENRDPAAEEPVIARCALHASTLEVKHPSTGELVKFEAPLPEDMQNLLDILRKYRKT
jgi:23S rRNA pseudouridine1911/1915/1917 synthase